MPLNNSKSFTCNVITKWGSIVQPIACDLYFTDIEKHPSPSTNPVTNKGFKEIEDSKFYYLHN